MGARNARCSIVLREVNHHCSRPVYPPGTVARLVRTTFEPGPKICTSDNVELESASRMTGTVVARMEGGRGARRHAFQQRLRDGREDHESTWDLQSDLGDPHGRPALLKLRGIALSIDRDRIRGKCADHFNAHGEHFS